jgi:hypothetical protein
MILFTYFLSEIYYRIIKPNNILKFQLLYNNKEIILIIVKVIRINHHQRHYFYFFYFLFFQIYLQMILYN